MSGEAYGHAYWNVREMAQELLRTCGNNPLRVAFARHLLKVSAAMHDVDWVDSGDSAEGSETNSILEVLGENWKAAALSAALDQIEEIKQELIRVYKGETK